MTSIKAKNIVMENGMTVEDMVNAIGKLTVEARETPISILATNINLGHSFGANDTDLQVPIDGIKRLGNRSLKLANTGNVITFPLDENIFSKLQIQGCINIKIDNSTNGNVSKRFIIQPRYYAIADDSFSTPINFSVKNQINIEAVSGARNHIIPINFVLNINRSITRGVDLVLQQSVATTGVAISISEASYINYTFYSDQY